MSPEQMLLYVECRCAVPSGVRLRTTERTEGARGQAGYRREVACIASDLWVGVTATGPGRDGRGLNRREAREAARKLVAMLENRERQRRRFRAVAEHNRVVRERRGR